MKALTLFVLTCGLAMAVDPVPETKNVVRELDVPGVFVKSEKTFGDPTVVTNTTELERLIPEKAQRDAVAKRVNLSKEYVIVFAWAGRKDDKLTAIPVTDTGGPVVFEFVPSDIREQSRYTRIFAIPRGVEWKIAVKANR